MKPIVCPTCERKVVERGWHGTAFLFLSQLFMFTIFAGIMLYPTGEMTAQCERYASAGLTGGSFFGTCGTAPEPWLALGLLFYSLVVLGFGYIVYEAMVDATESRATMARFRERLLEVR